MIVRAGLAARDITPLPDSSRSGLRILGFWYERAKSYHEVRDPLAVRAAVFAADDGSAVCLVSLDLIGDAIGLSQAIAQRVSEATGLPVAHIMVACVHAHTTPETIALSGFPVTREWFEFVVARATEAAVEAFRCAGTLPPCRLELDAVRVPDVNVNRRAMWWMRARENSPEELPAEMQCLDDRLRVAVLRDVKAGSIRGVLLHFACHPVAVQTQPFLSADYPGLLVRKVEEALGAPVLFINGAAGDLNPVRRDGYEDAEWTAERLAQAAVRRLRRGGRAGPVAGRKALAKVWGVRTVVPVRRRSVPEVADLQRERDELTTALEGVSNVDVRSRLGARLFRVAERLAVAELPTEFQAVVQILAVERWFLAGLPGEVFCCLGQRMERAAAEGGELWPVGYANGYLGYMAPVEAYEDGGYEVDVGRWSPLAPREADSLCDAAVGLVRAAKRALAQNSGADEDGR